MFLSLIVYSALFCEAFRWLGRRTAAAAALGMAYASVLVLAGFSLYVAWTALTLLKGP